MQPSQTAGQNGEAHPILEVIDAIHTYDGVVALDNVTVTASAGEFLTILGESGSGKTTLLRLISGLEKPVKVGALRLNGQDVSDVPAYARDCTTVFQNYALFPHMTVGANVEYGLKVRGVASAERRQRAIDALRLVRLADKFDRQVHQLSGGERQRVALARALVPRPAILLLDEPLGALDEKLRVDMQLELMDIHKRLGMTFIYITHSQEEALTMSDRIILMRQGRIAQAGTPQAMFDRPVSRFVAGFMGVENLIEGDLRALDGERATVEVAGTAIEGRFAGRGRRPDVGDKVVVGVRAERAHLGQRPADDAGINSIGGRLESAVYKGKYLDQTVTTPLGPLKVRLWDSAVDQSDGVVWWRKDDCMVMAA